MDLFSDNALYALMESTSTSTGQYVLCMQFCPPGSFKFTKCSFGAKGQQ